MLLRLIISLIVLFVILVAATQWMLPEHISHVAQLQDVSDVKEIQAAVSNFARSARRMNLATYAQVILAAVITVSTAIWLVKDRGSKGA